MGEILLALLADTAADHDQIGPEEVFDLVEILVETPRVLFPAQIFALAGAVCSAVFGVLATDLDVPELGVRYEPASDDERGADARPEREHQDHPILFPPGAPAHLSQTRGVGVVDHPHRAAELIFQPPLHVEADGSFVYVRRRAHDAALDHCRETTPDRALPAGLPDHLYRSRDYRLGG